MEIQWSEEVPPEYLAEIGPILKNRESSLLADTFTITNQIVCFTV